MTKGTEILKIVDLGDGNMGIEVNATLEDLGGAISVMLSDMAIRLDQAQGDKGSGQEFIDIVHEHATKLFNEESEG